MSEVSALITQIGFPIFCCLALGWYVKDTTNAFRQDAKEDKERMYQQLDRFGDSLDRFNTTLDNVTKKLNDIETMIKE